MNIIYGIAGVAIFAGIIGAFALASNPAGAVLAAVALWAVYLLIVWAQRRIAR